MMRTPIKILILLTIGVSLAAVFFHPLQMWLPLSRSGIEKFYLWQLLTYPLVQPGPLSFGFFLQLALNMYLLWMFGSSLIERSHTRLFLLLYFGASFVSGLAAIAFPHAVLAGSTNGIYALLIAWMMLNPHSKLLLFFTLPFKTHWLIAILLSLGLFFDVSNSDWPAAAALAAASLFGYFFALIVWREQSPFAILYPFERKILRLLEQRKQPLYHHSKIYDIKSGQPVLDDDQFMDAMLDRISLYGESSLTRSEKKRMQAISEKKGS